MFHSNRLIFNIEMRIAPRRDKSHVGKRAIVPRNWDKKDLEVRVEAIKIVVANQ